ncbi:MAG: RsmD family RNA methyltransferase, partial [Candidatus Limnocylindrales bacterium]
LFAVLEGGAVGPWPRPFLDLFAGSGAAGIEALSRGAPGVTFVEREARSAAVILANLSRLPPGLAAAGRLERADVLAFLAAGAAAGGGAYGAVLLDPPYGDATLALALARLGDPAGGWLEAEAVVVAKHFWRAAPAEPAGALVPVRTRRFGETVLDFYRLPGPGWRP